MAGQQGRSWRVRNEGGMVVTNDEEIYKRAKYFKNVCFPITGGRNYTHDDIGFNYRMSNVVAAIGLAQVEKADEYREMRISNHKYYRESHNKLAKAQRKLSRMQGSKKHEVKSNNYIKQCPYYRKK